MRYAVIDTNVLVSAQMTQYEDSATRRVVKFVFDGYVTPVVTPAILSEYQEVLSRPKFHFRQDVAETIVSHFRQYGKFAETTPYAKPIPDEKDRVFLEAALALFDDGAVLVTGNTKHFPPAPFVVTPTEFVASLETAKDSPCGVFRRH